MSDRPKCVIFGAGALGLGFLGPELSEDCDLTYADISAKSDVIELLKRERAYTINQTGLSMRAVRVQGVRGLLIGRDDPEIDAAVDEADFVVTAVGQPNLRHVAPTFARALARRGGRPLRILCSENGVEVSAGLRAAVAVSAGKEPEQALRVGETVMGRMCKVIQSPPRRIKKLGQGVDWAVVAEPFFGIPVQEHAVQGLEVLPVAVEPQSPGRFSASEDVKMLAHNALHMLLACLGRDRDLEYFDDLRSDPEVMEMGRQAVVAEAGPALLKKHAGALARNEYLNYCDSILRRITCPILHDPIARGVRSIMRKLEPHERIIYAARTIVEQGGCPETYAIGLASAVRLALEQGATDVSADEILTRHCGLGPETDAALLDLVRQAL